MKLSDEVKYSLDLVKKTNERLAEVQGEIFDRRDDIASAKEALAKLEEERKTLIGELQSDVDDLLEEIDLLEETG